MKVIIKLKRKNLDYHLRKLIYNNSKKNKNMIKILNINKNVKNIKKIKMVSNNSNNNPKINNKIK
jgi:hypothetical protein